MCVGLKSGHLGRNDLGFIKNFKSNNNSEKKESTVLHHHIAVVSLFHSSGSQMKLFVPLSLTPLC